MKKAIRSTKEGSRAIQKRYAPYACLLLAALLAIYGSAAGISWAAGARSTQTSLYPFPLDRFGLNVAPLYGPITDYDVSQLGAGWYLDYRYDANPARPGGMKYAQMLQVSRGSLPPNWTALETVIQANPGSLWLIGNEPDVISQDNRLPADYAMAYHELYTFIKSRDPSAKIAGPNIVQPTPLRLEWLQLAWDAYAQLYGAPMPVDVWSIHNQILQERRGGWGCEIPPGLEADEGALYSVWDNANLEIFQEHVVAFRQWMYDHGQREKPLIISEYGVLMPSEYLGGGDPSYGDQVVKDFMVGSFDYLLSATDPVLGCPSDGNRLVQQWAWYSLNDRLIDLEEFIGFNGSLFDWRHSSFPGVMTPFGEAFAQYTLSLRPRTLQLPLLRWNPPIPY